MNMMNKQVKQEVTLRTDLRPRVSKFRFRSCAVFLTWLRHKNLRHLLDEYDEHTNEARRDPNNCPKHES